MGTALLLLVARQVPLWIRLRLFSRESKREESLSLRIELLVWPPLSRSLSLNRCVLRSASSVRIIFMQGTSVCVGVCLWRSSSKHGVDNRYVPWKEHEVATSVGCVADHQKKK